MTPPLGVKGRPILTCPSRQSITPGTGTSPKTTTAHHLTLFQQYSHAACTSLRIRNHSPETKAQTAIKTRWCQSAIPSMSSPRLSFDNPNRPALHPFLQRGPTLMAQWRSLARPGLQGARGEEKNLTEHGPPPPPRTKQTGHQLPPAGNESGGRAPLTPRMLGRDGDGTPQVGLSGIQKGARGTAADWTPTPSCFVRQVYYSSTSAPVSGWLDGVLSASISRLLRNKATTITLCSRDCSLFWCRVSSCCCAMKLGGVDCIALTAMPLGPSRP